ncbi:hypothetical protein F2Q68_00017002 [Brassica cretica]|uniref:Uncharacterized protein n=1 Tax=Brassica cretica TaxID=69181 RepID=A0A8S9H7A2_BRACR|nr:hypothetical protein F2Q68_00017002 [Brassica cretica]
MSNVIRIRRVSRLQRFESSLLLCTVVKSERKLGVAVDDNVERVDGFGIEDGRVLDELQEPAKGEELVIKTVEADEFLAAVSPEDVVAKEMVVREEDGPRGSAEERSGETGDERQELIVRTVEDEHTCSVKTWKHESRGGNGAISCTCFKGDPWEDARNGITRRYDHLRHNWCCIQQKWAIRREFC